MKRRTFVRSTLAAGFASTLPAPVLSLATVPFHRPRQDQDIAAVTGDGREIVLPGSAISELDARLLGRVLIANRDGYDDARRVLNPSFDKYPALIAQVTGVADVRLAVD
ncbi:MAG: hypothetical protein WEA24_07520, partial [Gemmatimonadota bacterium]